MRRARWVGLLALVTVVGTSAGPLALGDVMEQGSSPGPVFEPEPMGFDLGVSAQPDAFAEVDLTPDNPALDLLGAASPAPPQDLWGNQSLVGDQPWADPVDPAGAGLGRGFDFSSGVTDFASADPWTPAPWQPALEIPQKPAGMSDAAWMHRLRHQDRDYAGLPAPHDRMVQAPYTMEQRQEFNEKFDASQPWYARWVAKGAGKALGWVALNPLEHGDVIDVMQENQYQLNRIYGWMEDNPEYVPTPEEAAGILAQQQYLDQMRGEYGQLWKEAGIKSVASVAGGPIVGKLAGWAKPVLTGNVVRDVARKTLPKVGTAVRDSASHYAPKTVGTLTQWGSKAKGAYDTWMPAAGKWAWKKETAEQAGYAVDAALGERPTATELVTQGVEYVDSY